MNTQAIRYGRQIYHVDVDKQRERNPKYPFSTNMQFCAKHSPDSEISEVCDCGGCHLEAHHD